MTYPFAPLPVVVEFWNGTTWVDISAYTYSRNGYGIDISRGLPDEGREPEPGSCSFELNNRDGRFSPRNPSGPYYGLIGRNTLVRVTVTGYGVRFVGEISEWPSRWDRSGRDVWVPVTAQGILRRLGQGSKPLRSPLTSMLLERVESGLVVAYWPMEEGGRSFGSGIPGHPSMKVTGATPDSGENGIGPLLGSDRIPVLAATTTITGKVRSYTPSGINRFAVLCLMDVPTTTGWSDNTPILWAHQSTSGSTIATWEVRYKSGSGGDLEVRALDETGTQLATSGTLDFNIDGRQIALMLDVRATVDATYSLTMYYLDDDGAVQNTTSLSVFGGLTPNRATGVVIAPNGGLAEAGVGQVAVSASTFASPVTEIEEWLVAFVGEVAAARAERLGEEVGVTVNLVTAVDEDETQPMGAQPIPATFLEALNDSAAADLALLFETRDALELSWRSRVSLYNQTVALTLDYTGAGEVAPDLEPTDDDQHVRNDITVKRTNGSSARVVDETSPLSVNDPPAGVGRYDTEVELNLYDDAVLVNFAGWLVHLGTWDEARYPRVHVDMKALAAQGKTSLMTAAAALDVGDRIQITNPPSWLPPDTIDLMVLGFAETNRHPIDWDITLVCVPYGPYNIGEYQDTDASGDVSRYDTAGCETLAGAWLSGSSFDITTPDDASLDITGDLDIRVDATAASWLSGSTQTLVAKYGAGTERSYFFRVNGDGTLALLFSTDGTADTTRTSTVAVPKTAGRLAVRVTMDVNDGGGNHVVRFYTATAAVGLSDLTWTQLGDAVTTAGTVSIHSGTEPLQVGVRSTGVQPFAGVIHAAQVRSGIAGTIVAYPRPDTQAAGTTSFADLAGRTWTLTGAPIYHDFVSGTDTTLLVGTTSGRPWTQAAGDLPMELECAGAVLEVTAVTGAGAPQLLTVTQAAANGVAKTIEPGEPIALFREAFYGL